MPNRKTSAEHKKLKGTYRPDRDKKNTPVSDTELGAAPEFMTGAEKSAWDEISGKLPPGVATVADSLAFEILVKLMVKFRTAELTGGETTILMRSLAKFGLTPVDRSSVSAVPKKRKDNPFAKFGLQARQARENKWK